MENNGSQPSPSQPVMDIQPPKPAAENSGWPNSAPPPSSGVGAAPQATTPGMAQAPASWGDSSAAPASPAPAPGGSGALSALAEANPDQQHPGVHNPMAIPPHAAGKHKAPLGVVIGAILIALLLAVAAVFAYMKTQDKTNTTAKANVPKIGVSDVNDTEQKLNDSLNGANDTQDFASSDLSDTALGL
jgi:hypothetical protein